MTPSPLSWKGAEEFIGKAWHSISGLSASGKNQGGEESPIPSDPKGNEGNKSEVDSPVEGAQKRKNFLGRVKDLLHLSNLNTGSASRVPAEALKKDDSVVLPATGTNFSTSHRIVHALVTQGILQPFARVFVPGLNESMYAWKASQLGIPESDWHRVEKNGRLMSAVELKKELQKYHLGAAETSKDRYAVDGKKVNLKHLAEGYTYLVGPFVTRHQSYMPWGVEQFIPYQGVRLGFFDPDTGYPISATVNPSTLTDEKFWSDAIESLGKHETSRAMVFTNGQLKLTSPKLAHRHYRYVPNEQLLDGIVVWPK